MGSMGLPELLIVLMTASVGIAPLAIAIWAVFIVLKRDIRLT